jgi:hypothetical protein
MLFQTELKGMVDAVLDMDDLAVELFLSDAHEAKCLRSGQV